MKFKLPFEKTRQTHTTSVYGDVRIEAVSTQENFAEGAPPSLKQLIEEEAKLMEEKQNLASLNEKLQVKIRKNINLKKNNIKKLRDEIKELRFSCEELTNTLNPNISANS